jgi:hypothetical protein
MAKQETIGVITGDLIRYSRYPNESREFLAQALGYAHEKYRADFQVYRGDSFQGIVPVPKDALRVAVLIRSFLIASPIVPYVIEREGGKKMNLPGAHFKLKEGQAPDRDVVRYLSKRLVRPYKIDARISVGVGKSDHISEDIGDSDGEAFRLSGERLDVMKKLKQNLSVLTPCDDLNQELEIEAAFLDGIMLRWTRAQAVTVFFALQGKSQDELTELLSISQSAVSQNLRRSNLHAVDLMLKRFEVLMVKGV